MMAIITQINQDKRNFLGELLYFKKLLTEVYPTGIVSIVSDTYNLWRVITEILPILKKDIMARDGKLVIRPDSSRTTPQDIICGTPNRTWTYNNQIWDKAEEDGLIETLYNIFGGSISKEGYKVLDPHIGAIYGDSITYERAEEIFSRLEKKGFASTNIVLGIGSYTYQYNTRDTFGFAMKATYGEVGHQPYSFNKDPITDKGFKKSATGLARTGLTGDLEDNLHSLLDIYSDSSMMNLIYENGDILSKDDYDSIVERVRS